MFAILLFIVFIAAEVLIFSAPARIPMLRQWAMTHRTKRWAVIVLLSLIPTLVNYVGGIWIKAKTEIMFASWTDGAYLCNEPDQCYSNPETLERINTLDAERRDGLINELTLRRLFLMGERHCFSRNADVCEDATMWQRIEQEQQAYYSASMSFGVALLVVSIVIFLSPSFLTGYIVHRITCDNRKQKRD